MKNLKSFALISVFVFGCTLFTPTAHAQTVTGPVREIKFTALPKFDKNAGVKEMNGYEVEITFKYRFQLCAGVITLDGYRTANVAVAYWVAGKRYSRGDLQMFNTQNKTSLAFATNKSDLYPNLDFEADIHAYKLGNAGTTEFFAKGKWTWVNLPDWGGCLGDYGNGSSGDCKQYEPKMTSTNKNRVGSLFLKDVKPKDAPNRDYALEAALSGKKRRPLEEFKDVKQVTENLKNEARTEDANRRGVARNALTRNAPTRNAQTDDDLLNDTGYGNKQQDLDALLGSTGYGSEKEITDRQLAAADAAAQNVSSFSDRTRLLEAKRLYEKALAADLNATTPDAHAANQLKRIEWILKNAGVEINGVIWALSNVGKPKEFVEKPEDYGGYYTWEEAKNVCPDGWRLPTREELAYLTDKTQSEWTGKGRNYANGKLFFPAEGYNGNHGKVGVGWRGVYWSSSQGDWGEDSRYYLFFTNDHNFVGSNWAFINPGKGESNYQDKNTLWSNIILHGFCVRCVQNESKLKEK